jgi:hypothetical protein
MTASGFFYVLGLQMRDIRQVEAVASLHVGQQ